MADRNKNRKSPLRDFIRYHSDKMNGEESNAFERELQKDPFAREASEGFASIEPHEVMEDTADLQKRLKKRVLKRQRLTVYRIAVLEQSDSVKEIELKRPENISGLKKVQQLRWRFL